MTIGGVEMTWSDPEEHWNPDTFTPPDDDKVCSAMDTETSAAFFTFGFRLIGKEIELYWRWMSAALFDALDAVFAAGLPVTWDLDRPGIPDYEVEITALDGKTFDVVGYDFPYREEVRLRFVIVGVGEMELS